MKNAFVTILSLFFLSTLGSASCEKEELSENAEFGDLKNRETEIRALVANKSCAPDRTCGAIGFGAKPCGGPWTYLVYSLNAADLKTLTEKVDAYNQLERELNVKYGKASDCAMVMPPTVGCVDGTCATK
jgi:hypothetical protein